MKKIFEEFKGFAFKGDLITLAVAFVMGVAFAAVIGAVVDDLIMPIVGIIFGEPSFNGLTWTINDSVIYWGAVVSALVRFLAIAFGVFFFVVKPYTMFKDRVSSGDEEAPAPSDEIVLLTEIRDALRNRA
ncbi:MAG: large conductance mechanosensitive channel protein MscL [Acidimicrobiia bacterium]|jgi:large conductance mechanosensitive channel